MNKVLPILRKLQYNTYNVLVFPLDGEFEHYLLNSKHKYYYSLSSSKYLKQKPPNNFIEIGNKLPEYIDIDLVLFNDFETQYYAAEHISNTLNVPLVAMINRPITFNIPSRVNELLYTKLEYINLNIGGKFVDFGKDKYIEDFDNIITNTVRGIYI